MSQPLRLSTRTAISLAIGEVSTGVGSDLAGITIEIIRRSLRSPLR